MALAQMSPERPPNIEFREDSIEDRNATMAAGRLVLKSQNIVEVRAIGCKDSTDFIADEWLNQQDSLAAMGRLPNEWAAFYRKKYDAWKKGLSGDVVNGFPIRDWASISKAMAANAISIGIHTVEDLAAANEETLSRLGMGARALKDKAVAFLDASGGKVNAEELAALRAENATKDQRIASLESRLEALEATAAKKKG